MRPYESLQPAAQVERLRPYALYAAKAFGIHVSKIHLLNHGFNTTFAVRDSRQARYALRINLGWARDPAAIRAEVAWTQALSRDTDLNVVQYLPTPTGEFVVPIEIPGLPRTAFAVLAEWLPGRDVEDSATPQICRHMGRAMRTMHEHAKSFTVQMGAAFPVYDDVIAGQRWNLEGHEFTPVFEEIRRRGQNVLDRLLVSRCHPIHFDMHFYNVKFHCGRITIFDFDDSVHTHPDLDPVQMLYYVRSDANWERLEAAMWEGYGAPEISPDDIEILVGARNVLLCNDTAGQTNAELRAILPSYLDRSGKRLSKLLETGRYHAAS